MDNTQYTKRERKTRSKLHRIKRNTNFDIVDSKRWKFEYHDNTWSCPLKAVRCHHEIPRTGLRCSRRSTLSAVYCWQHLKTVAKLRIAPTQMEDDKKNVYEFLGLFVCDTKKGPNVVIFKKGDLVTSYVGEILTRNQLEEKYPDEDTAPYVFMQTGNRYIDAACFRSVAAMTNACRTTNKKCKINAKLSVGGSGNFPAIVATKNIKNGEEIFVSYGRSYFNANSVHRNFVTKPDREYKTKNYKC